MLVPFFKLISQVVAPRCAYRPVLRAKHLFGGCYHLRVYQAPSSPYTQQAVYIRAGPRGYPEKSPSGQKSHRRVLLG